MEIFTLLEQLEDILEKSKTVPFTDKSIVEKNEILNIIKDIRIKLPDELKEAKWIKTERERIIDEAQKEASDIVKEAENRIIAMIDEHEITKKAYARKNEIIEGANDVYREVTQATNSYADEILAKLEKNMMELGKNLSNVEIAIQDALESIQSDRRGLK